MSENSVVEKWREMAPAMKRIVVHTAVTLALSAAAMFFLVLPAVRKNASLSASFDAMSENFDKTHDRIASTGVQREATTTAEAKLKSMVDSGVLVPLLGSLEMRAMAFVAPLASASGVAIVGDSVKSMAQRPIKDPKLLQGRVFVRQPVEFSGSGTYAQIVAFIQAVEEKLPMVTLSSLRIVSQSRTPEVHAMTVLLEWPISVEKKLEKDDEGQRNSGAPK